MTDVTEAAIASWRLCLTHEPQPGLGQFNWPWALGAALDEIERLSAAEAALQRVRGLCDEAERKWAHLDAAPPIAEALTTAQVRAVLDTNQIG